MRRERAAVFRVGSARAGTGRLRPGGFLAQSSRDPRHTRHDGPGLFRRRPEAGADGRIRRHRHAAFPSGRRARDAPSRSRPPPGRLPRGPRRARAGLGAALRQGRSMSAALCRQRAPGRSPQPEIRMDRGFVAILPLLGTLPDEFTDHETIRRTSTSVAASRVCPGARNCRSIRSSASRRAAAGLGHGTSPCRAAGTATWTAGN